MAPALSLLVLSQIGLLACAFAIVLAQAGTKRIVLLILGLSAVALAVFSRHPRPVLLFTWIVALTYNRQYFSFDAVFGNNGSQGVYWIPSDPALVALLALWCYERIGFKRRTEPRGTRIWPWLLPFFVAALLSMPAAEMPNWGLFELLRMAKVALILALVRYQVTRRDWWTCVAAFAFIIAAQSMLALLQVTMNVGSGFLSLFQDSGPTGNTLTVVLAGREQARAGGTMVHPNILGPYLLLIIPIFVCLGLAARQRLAAMSFLGVAGIGVVGVTCTMSRLPWALTVVQIAAACGILAVLRAVRFSRLVGTAVTAAIVMSIALAPVATQVYERVTSDLSESIELRSRYNQIALAMIRERPLCGVGLNNFRAHLGAQAPDFEAMLQEIDPARTEIGLRIMAPVHNFYLLILAETGVVGLVGWLIFLVGALRLGARAIRTTTGFEQAACVGMVIGLVGEIVQQSLDYSLWTDPTLYTFALVVGLLNVAGTEQMTYAVAPIVHRRSAHALESTARA